jgi:hypothetical protein
MNDNSDIGWFTKLLFRVGWTIAFIFLFAICIAPIALPFIRLKVTQKYSECTHKDTLIAQEMMIWKIITFGLMIFGWSFFFFAQSQY